MQDSNQILPADMAALNQVQIGNTGASVGQVISALCDLLDGEQDHAIEAIIGSAEIAESIIQARAAVRAIWENSLQ